MLKVLNKIEKITIYITLLTLPVILLPNFINPYTTTKLSLLALTSVIVILIKALKIFLKGEFEYSFSKLNFGIITLISAYILSGTLVSPNKMEAFFLPGTASIYIFGGVLFLTIADMGKKTKSIISKTLLFSAVLASISILFLKSGVIETLDKNIILKSLENMNDIGLELQATMYLVSIIPVGIYLIFSDKQVLNKFFWGVTLAVLLFGLTLNILDLFNRQNQLRLPPLSTSWEIALSSLKENSVLGVGPGNYLTAFNKYRPISYNKTDLWNIRFPSASNQYLTLISETGLLGLTSLILIYYSLIKIVFNKSQGKIKMSPEVISIASTTIFSFLLPAGLPNIILILVMFALVAKNQKHTLYLISSRRRISENPENLKEITSPTFFINRIPALVLSLIIVASLSYFSYYSIRILYADFLFKKSLTSTTDKPSETGRKMINVIKLNPYIDRYHASFAQFNLSVVKAIIQDAQSQKKEVSEEDRGKIAQLSQQAINEGKATVALNIQRSGNWEFLGNIYKNIAPLATGADKFAIQTYTQAIALDPLNPDLRITLGGLFYSSGDFDSAIDIFKLAVLAKPDYANSHYNLAIAYREKGETDKAITEMTTTLSLIDKNSSDFQFVKSQLEKQQKTTKEKELDKPKGLTTPTQSEQPVIKPPLQLPENATPPSPNNQLNIPTSIP